MQNSHEQLANLEQNEVNMIFSIFCVPIILSIYNYCELTYASIHHIYQNTEINDSHISAIANYFLVARSNASGLMVIRITDDDFGNPVTPSTTMLTRDLTPPKHRVMYNYQFHIFAAFLLGGILLDSKKSDDVDYLIIIDVLNNTTTGIPLLQKQATGVFVMATAEQTTSQIHIANEPQSVILTNRKEQVIVQSASNDECGIVVRNSPVVWNKMNGEIVKLPSDLRAVQAKDHKYYTQDHKYSCAVGLLWNTYGLQQNQTTLLKYVQSQATYKLLSILLSALNTRLMVNIRTPESRMAYVECSHVHYLRFFYNDLYWFDSVDNGMFGKIPTDTLVCLETEEIVWIVVNPDVKVFNWNTVVIAVLGASSTLLASLILEHATGYKYPLQMTVILMWSVFLTVSVPKQPQKYLFRVLFFSWTLSSSVITLCYYYKMFNALSNPTSTRYQNSEEVLQSDVNLLAYELKYVNLAFEWATKKGFQNDVQFLNKPQKKHFLELVQQYADEGVEFALVLDTKYFRRILPLISDVQYYTMSQKVTSYPDCFYATYADPLTSYIRKKAALIAAAGIVDKLSGHTKRNEKSVQILSKIKLRYLLNIYILVGILYCIAFVIFIAEIIVYRFKNRTTSNQNEIIQVVERNNVRRRNMDVFEYIE